MKRDSSGKWESVDLYTGRRSKKMTEATNIGIMSKFLMTAKVLATMLVALGIYTSIQSRHMRGTCPLHAAILQRR